MSLFVEPRMSPSSGGNNYAGAKLYFYLTGTTTPAAIYTDAARTTQHANPVIADSGGVFPPIWLDPTLDYRRVLKTSAGASISDVDPYPGASINQDELGLVFWPPSDEEDIAGLDVIAGWRDYGDLRRYGIVFDDDDSSVMADNSTIFNLAVQAWKNSGQTIKIRGGQAFHFNVQLLVSAAANTACRLNFEQDRDCVLTSHVTGSVDKTTFTNDGFGILFDGWKDSQWNNFALNFDAGTAGIALRCRNASCVYNDFVSARIEGGDVAADKNDRTRIAVRFIGNESVAGSTGYVTYWNTFLGGKLNIAQKLVEYLVGDGDAATRQPNAQKFLGTQLERYWIAHEFNDTDEHFITGAWHDNAPGASVGTASSLTQAAGTATCTLTAHGLETDDIVQISGASPADYIGVARITKTGANTFTYTKTNGVAIPGGTTSPATGTITVVRLSVGYYGDTTYSQFGGNVEAGANAISYFIKDGGAGGNLIQIIDNNATNSVVEDTTESNLILDRQFIDSSNQVTLRVNRSNVATFSPTAAYVAGTLDIGHASDTTLSRSSAGVLALEGVVLSTYGTYTPTLTNVTNMGASTARLCTYSRVGNTVTVGGQIDVDPTGAGATEVGISLPVASALTTAYQLGGSGAAFGIAGLSVAIDADATNDRARMRWIAVDISNQPVMFSFTYQVL